MVNCGKKKGGGMYDTLLLPQIWVGLINVGNIGVLNCWQLNILISLLYYIEFLWSKYWNGNHDNVPMSV